MLQHVSNLVESSLKFFVGVLTELFLNVFAQPLQGEIGILDRFHEWQHEFSDFDGVVEKVQSKSVPLKFSVQVSYVAIKVFHGEEELDDFLCLGNCLEILQMIGMNSG